MQHVISYEKRGKFLQMFLGFSFILLCILNIKDLYRLCVFFPCSLCGCLVALMIGLVGKQLMKCSFWADVFPNL